MALFNYVFAKRHGGAFILRIEDTDQARSTPESEREIIDALQWLGLAWDEGPDAGGDAGPYRQSERAAIYREQCRELVNSGQAYPCFCRAERLAEVRARQQAEKAEFMGYDGHCAGLDPAEAQARVEAGEAHVVRLRTPAEGECVMTDRLRGEIRVPWGMVDDQILMKADGFPTYHLANVVDDHLMGISHVIRGEEWVGSLPKHLRLYEAFGWTPPEFIHLPLLRNPDKSKLSKRKNPTSILYYRRAGFLPEALLNFLGLMAYSPPDGNEVFSLDAMCADFDVDRISLGGPIFDIVKLRDFNGRYIRGLDEDALFGRLQDWLLNDATWRAAVPLAKPRLAQLTDFVPAAAFIFADRLDYPPESLAATLADATQGPALLRTLQWQLEAMRTWDVDTVQGIFRCISETESIPLKKVMPFFYVTVTGRAAGLPLYDSMVLVGRDLCLRRIQYALDALEETGHVLKGKKLKRFTKDYEARYGRRDT